MAQRIGVKSLTELSAFLIQHLVQLYKEGCFQPLEATLTEYMERANFSNHLTINYRVHRMRKHGYTTPWIGSIVELCPSRSRLGAREMPPSIGLGLYDGIPDRACDACAGGGCNLNSFEKQIRAISESRAEMEKKLVDSLHALRDKGKWDAMLFELRQRFESFAPEVVYSYEINFQTRYTLADEKNDMDGPRTIPCFLWKIGLPIPTGATSRIALGPEPLMTPPARACDACWGTGVYRERPGRKPDTKLPAAPKSPSAQERP